MFLIKKVFLTGESKQAQISWLLTWLMSVLFLSQDVYVHGVYMLLFRFIHQISFDIYFKNILRHKFLSFGEDTILGTLWQTPLTVRQN